MSLETNRCVRVRMTRAESRWILNSLSLSRLLLLYRSSLILLCLCVYCDFDIYSYHRFSCFSQLLLVARVDIDMTVIPIIVIIFADTSRTALIVNINVRNFMMIICYDMTIVSAVMTGTLGIIYITSGTVLS